MNPHQAVASFDQIINLRDMLRDLNRANDFSALFARFCAENFINSHAQLFQDLLVIFLLRGKREGFFVEFGATNGRDLSNTLMLEELFSWKGLLAEPAKCWHSALRANRKALIDTRCVWTQTGEQLEFLETEWAEVSTIRQLAELDYQKNNRSKGTVYSVETISLNELLKAHNVPREIDYVSIDTEGSEAAILKAFNFAEHDIKIMTVEHNYVEANRQAVFELLIDRGFVRLFEPLSKFDDWYVERSILGP
ncbi:FkbM family methyltransferase [Bradyrhizobium sp. AUGA SZCCT0169]|uniref:FkbM family methyltransferase n=1 Tax=Bradyrhizobium sp. AUGA SZCCT0169 TaxID=2807663 RepID=UPI001BA527A0|nr:FkbM family methyltransferase [Bradyrhizobium sp. AUGA SZCCT0169]MBR1248000.1 FkbM family methyltransferase [Bradyrhizobium sp. AUGA SZCCT0169]